MPISRYDTLLDSIIAKCLPPDQDKTFSASFHEPLYTVRKGVCKAKVRYAKQGKLPNNLRLVITEFDFPHANTKGLTFKLVTINKVRAEYI